MLDQDLLGQVGMTEEIEGLGTEPESQGIAMLTPPRRHDLQRTLFEPGEMPEEWDAPGHIDKYERMNRLRHARKLTCYVARIKLAYSTVIQYHHDSVRTATLSFLPTAGDEALWLLA